MTGSTHVHLLTTRMKFKYATILQLSSWEADWELTQWEVDLLGVDLVGVDFVRGDLVGLNDLVTSVSMVKPFPCKLAVLTSSVKM